MFSGKRMEESAPTLNLADVRRIIEPLYEGQKLFTGESVMAHAEDVVDILRGIRDDDDLLAAAYNSIFFVGMQVFFKKIRKNG